MLLNSFFYLAGGSPGAGGAVVPVRLNPEHAIFKAHFPSRPIMPGVCQVQMVTEVLSLRLGREVSLTDIVNVKYLSVVSPDEVTELEVRFLKMANENGTCKVSAVLSAGDRVFSKMSMVYHVVCSDPDL